MKQRPLVTKQCFIFSGGRALRGFSVPTVSDEMNHKVQQTVANFLKMAKKRLAKGNENDNE